jgi:hypothetical protein
MTTTRWLTRRLLLLPSVLALAAGCGGNGVVPVAGTVTLDGRPLADASVVLAQLRATDPGPFVGKTDAEGKFTLGATTRPGSGAAVGDYRLMITTVTGGSMEDSPLPTQKEVVPGNYRSGMMKFAIPAGGTQDANFDLKSK